jgi:hypothetical protein
VAVGHKVTLTATLWVSDFCQLLQWTLLISIVKPILFRTIFNAKNRELYLDLLFIYLTNWLQVTKSFLAIKEFFLISGGATFVAAVQKRTPHPSLSQNINPVHALISYLFNFNIIPHLLQRLPSILVPVSPPQLCLYFSPIHDTGPTQLILLYSIYTVSSVGTFYCPSSSIKPNHQNTQFHIYVRFQKNRRLSHIKQRSE